MTGPLTLEIIAAASLVSALSAYWYYLHHRYRVPEWGEFLLTQSRRVPERAVISTRGKEGTSKPGLHVQTYASTKSSRAVLEAVEGADPSKELEDSPEKESITTGTVRIQKGTIGVFIGKLGSNIKQIQKDSNTLMHLNDEVLDNGDRICVIRGSRDCVSLAMEIIAKFLESLPIVVFKEILIPMSSVGRIIGVGGEGIRSIEEKSSASVHVDVDREAQNGEKRSCRFAVVKGTKEQIEKAEEIILAQIQEHTSLAARGKTVVVDANRTTSVMKPSIPEIIVEPFQQPYLGLHGKVEVFVSCVYNPNMFWIQLIGKESIDLRRLSQAMTDFYRPKNSRQCEGEPYFFRPGEVVAAPFQSDGKMYRARVLRVNRNKTLEVLYVDYGDIQTLRTNFVRPLMPEFFRLKFQAIKASLNLSCPEMTWPEDTVAKFCDLSYCAKWKSLTAEFKGFVTDDRNGEMTRICIELMDKDRNLGLELIQKGLATKRDSILLVPPIPVYRKSS
ncbi:unnamed protein product [Allacma fusca]|uniref:Tudor domain-containing protein n=2 Tax=Allacma fusca TaxID=39272 RepID=A0A8J2LML5_9HEXA|nr:unnamed protein product [Allacma fusca]